MAVLHFIKYMEKSVKLSGAIQPFFEILMKYLYSN